MRPKSAKTLLPMSKADLYWLAGLWEGEGTIRLQSRNFHNKNGKRYGPYSYPRASIGMTDRDVIEHVGRILGVGKMYTSHTHASPGHEKPFYTWVVSTTKDV